MKTKNTRWFLAAALAAVILSLAACAPGAGSATAQGTPTAVPPVIAPQGVVSDGRIVPVQTASLSFTSSGVVAEVLVKEGETVKAGQVIARLNGAEQRQAAVAAAQMELLSAQQEIDALKEGVDLARAQAQLKVAEADKELDKATKRRISRDYHVGSQEATDLAWADYIRGGRRRARLRVLQEPRSL
jgi:multidrug efflux pump subunit AcrA (membrane-fusion protein)